MVAVADPLLVPEIERIVAATERTLIFAGDAGSIRRQAWARASVVIIDGADPSAESLSRLPRRPRVVLVCRQEPTAEVWQRAVRVGAEHVLTVPADEGRLVEVCSSPTSGAVNGRAPVIAALGGRGGAGASTLSAALALAIPGESLLVDADPYGGGIDLLLGWERLEGLRWPDIDLRSGRVAFGALRRALPHRRDVIILSGNRSGGVWSAAAIGAVVDSARGAGVPVVVDVPRRLGPVATQVLERADLVAVVTPAEVRACASSALIIAAVQAVNPNVGVVVRGPSPSGLRASEVAQMSGAPLLVAMRPEPRLGPRLDNGGLRMSHRSPLLRAARSVVELVRRGEARAVA